MYLVVTGQSQSMRMVLQTTCVKSASFSCQNVFFTDVYIQKSDVDSVPIYEPLNDRQTHRLVRDRRVFAIYLD